MSFRHYPIVSDADSQSTPFRSELDRLSLLDLTLPFQALQRTVLPLTTTLPITLHNLPTLASTFHDFYTTINDGQDQMHSGLDSALQLHRALFETTLGEAIAHVAEATSDICRIASLRALEPKLVERAYSTLSLSLRAMASTMLKSDSTSATALSETWAALRPYLASDHKRYIRRCAADAWVGVVRKARGEGLQRLAKMLLEEDTEGMEAIWAHTLRGTSGQLHSRALPIFEILLDNVADRPTEAKSATLLKVTTALVHHTTASTIVPVIETVLKRITPAEEEGSLQHLQVLSTLLYVRKGKRFPEALLKPTMLKLVEIIPSLPKATLEWRQGLMEAVVGSLIAGKLAQWLSPGVHLIERYWDGINIEERFAFVNALIKLRWAGVEQFVIPHIARTILPSLQVEPLHALVLLNNLAEAGFLTGSLANVQGGRWRQSLVSALEAVLRTKHTATSDVSNKRILGQLLHLLPSLAFEGSAFAPHVQIIVRSIVSRYTDKGNARADFMSDTWNDSHLLAGALGAIAGFDTAGTLEDEIKQQVSSELGAIIGVWTWNREVLAKASELEQSWQW